LSTFRARLLVALLALGLGVACALTARLPRVPGVLPIIPSILPPFLALGLRVTRCDPSDRPHGERQRRPNHTKPNRAVHVPFSPLESCYRTSVQVSCRGAMSRSMRLWS